MSNYEIVTIGSTLIDLLIQSNELGVKRTTQGLMLCELLGDKIEVDEFTVTTGGGASNTAIGFARQGFKVATMSEMGHDALAEKIIQDLRDEQVETRFITQEKREMTGISVILIAPDGQRTVMVHRGGSSLLEKKDVNWEVVAEAKWVHVSNVSGQLPLLKKLFTTVAGKNDPGLSWNPGKQDIKLLTSYQLTIEPQMVDILFVNEQEWKLLGSIQSTLKSRISNIVITSGNQGGRVLSVAGELKYEVEKQKAVDETGAGDSFAVGFVSEYLRGGELEDCLNLAKKNAASVVGQVGAKSGLLKVLN